MTESIPILTLPKANFFGISNKEGNKIFQKSKLSDTEKSLAMFMIELSHENSFDMLTEIEVEDKEKGNSLTLEFKFNDDDSFPFNIEKRKATKFEIYSEYIPLETLGIIRISK